jgi:hypothetical protein
MKKYLTIFLAFLILVTSSPTGQGIQAVVKIGAFLHHFVHHIGCHQEKIGLKDFIRLHYFDHEHHEADHAEHEKLPFQHDHHNQRNISPENPFLLGDSQLIIAFPNLDICSNELIARPQQLVSSLHTGNIWQPPKT